MKNKNETKIAAAVIIFFTVVLVVIAVAIIANPVRKIKDSKPMHIIEDNENYTESYVSETATFIQIKNPPEIAPVPLVKAEKVEHKTVESETKPAPEVTEAPTEPATEATTESEESYEYEDKEASNYTDDDVTIMAKIIAQEAGGADEHTKLLVGNVVRNRVESSSFPDTYYGVATQNYQYGMMWAYGVNWPDYADESMKEDCIVIAERILNGETVCPAGVVFQAEFIQGEIFEEADGMYFCFA